MADAPQSLQPSYLKSVIAALKQLERIGHENGSTVTLTGPALEKLGDNHTIDTLTSAIAPIPSFGKDQVDLLMQIAENGASNTGAPASDRSPAGQVFGPQTAQQISGITNTRGMQALNEAALAFRRGDKDGARAALDRLMEMEKSTIAFNLPHDSTSPTPAQPESPPMKPGFAPVPDDIKAGAHTLETIAAQYSPAKTGLSEDLEKPASRQAMFDTGVTRALTAIALGRMKSGEADTGANPAERVYGKEALAALTQMNGGRNLPASVNAGAQAFLDDKEGVASANARGNAVFHYADASKYPAVALLQQSAAEMHPAIFRSQDASRPAVATPVAASANTLPTATSDAIREVAGSSGVADAAQAVADAANPDKLKSDKDHLTQDVLNSLRFIPNAASPNGQHYLEALHTLGLPDRVIAEVREAMNFSAQANMASANPQPNPKPHAAADVAEAIVQQLPDGRAKTGPDNPR